MEDVHESNDLLQKKDSLPIEKYGILKGSSHLKYALNAISSKLVIVKQITSKSISQDLVLQNCFGPLSSGEQEAQRVMSNHLGRMYS